MTRGSAAFPPRRSNIRRRGGTFPWYASTLEFQDEVERGLASHVEHAGQVAASLAPQAGRKANNRVLVYQHCGLEVPGRYELAPVLIEFHEQSDPSGLAPRDYPRVVADLDLESPHRLLDDALCLWFPDDPVEQRWTSSDGLVSLLDIVRNHLFFEDHWRRTGGSDGGEWLGREAPHGRPERTAA